MDIPQLLRRLQADNTAGASTLLALALDILDTFAEHLPAYSAHGVYRALTALVEALLTAQPSMAPLITLAHQVLQACPQDLPPATAQEQLQHTLLQFWQHLRLSAEALCRQALHVIPPQATVLTYSNSATVIAALHYAHQHGRLGRVLLSESRPAYDGRLQARALLDQGITVEYGVDMALFDWIPAAQVILVGADAVFPQGVVNKLGTHALAQITRCHKVPIFCLCTSQKFLPVAAVPLVRFVDHPGQEVWPDAPPGVRLHNRYFDTTPLALFSSVVSENGLHTPEALRLQLQHQELSPALLQLASGRAAGNDQRVLAADRLFLERLQQS
jgi:translation initiation factor 2B subunit (eIF-2B alpha/beta/delta family)